LLAASAIIYLGYSVFGVIGSIIGVGMLVTLMGILLLNRCNSIHISTPSNLSSVKEYYNYSLPVTVGNAGDILYKRSDIILISYLLTSSAVGIYNVAFLVGTLIALPVSGVNQLFPPIASRLYSSDEMTRLKNLYRIITRWLFTVSLFLGIFLATYRREVLALFGEEFPEGSFILLLIIAVQVINSLTGPSGYLLMMTDHQYIKSINTWTFGVCNIVLNYLLIIRYGIIGAAMATFLTKSALSAVRMMELWKLEGFFPYTYAYFKPIVAAIISASLMNISLSFIGGIKSMIVGGVLGVLIYGLILFFSIGGEDREIMYEIFRG
jgi:O-antigen/teichoic acid export membrane protein